MRVLLVDDNPEFLMAAQRFLSLAPRLEVVGHANSGEEAIDRAKTLRPELVLINWSLPGVNGLEAIRRIQAQPNPPKIIMLSPQDYPEYRLAAKEAGAEGFISKSEFGQKIFSLIEYLIAQEELIKPQQTNSSGSRNGKDFIPPVDRSPAGGFSPGGPEPARPAEESSEPPGRKPGTHPFEQSASASVTADRPPAVQRMPEIIATLREGLTALEAHYLYLQRWLEARGEDSVSGPGDPTLKVQKFLGPFPQAAAYYLLFEIHGERYALPADQVLSVEKQVPLIQLPREYQPLVGMADIDNRRVPIIDLRLWEGLEKAPHGEAGRVILVETRKSAAGLLVDSVRELTTSAGSNGFPLPSNPEGGRKPYLDRLIQTKDRFIFVWDVDKIMDYLNLRKK
jgi:DNA-binding NarL/FixJ family response regulator/chemotaxis signal transduction protein